MKKQLSNLIHWLLFTSVFAAACAVSLCIATECLILQKAPDIFTALHGYIAGCTLVVYNTHFLIRKGMWRKLYSKSIIEAVIDYTDDWSVRNWRWHIAFIIAGATASLYSILWLGWEIILVSVFLGILSFLYTIPMLPFGKGLRDYGIVKILTLTLVWTVTTVVFPILYWGKELSNYPMELAMRFVFMLTLCAAFDIRDMSTDAGSDIKTLPNIIGLKQARLLLHAGLIVFLLLSIIQYNRYGSERRLAAEIITVFAAYIVLRNTKRPQTDTYYLGCVDGLMLLNGFLVFIFSTR